MLLHSLCGDAAPHPNCRSALIADQQLAIPQNRCLSKGVGSAALLPAATEEPPLSMQKPGWQYHEYHADIEVMASDCTCSCKIEADIHATWTFMIAGMQAPFRYKRRASCVDT